MANQDRDDYNRERRWYGSGYWMNEPDFVDARREQQGDRQQARDYDEDDVRRYREAALNQRYRENDPRFDRREHYLNQGWTRSAAREQDRDWGYYRGGDITQSRQGRLELNYDEPSRGRYYPREYLNRGSKHEYYDRMFDERNQSRRKSRNQNVERQHGRSPQERDYSRSFDQDRGRDWGYNQDIRIPNRPTHEDLDFDRGRDWGYDMDRRPNYRGNFESERSRGDLNLDRGRDWGYDRAYDQGGVYDYGDNTNLRDFGRRDIEDYGMYEQRRPDRGFDYDWQGTQYDEDFRYRETWNTPGPHAGKGPKNYQRSDERIFEQVCERLSNSGQINSTGIEVQVENGEVTLHGQVDRKREKRMAEDAVSSISGVKDVNNRLRVTPNDGARVRGMGREDVVMRGRILKGMRVLGIDGKFAGEVKEVRDNGFTIDHDGKETFIPFRAVRRTNGSILLEVASDRINQQNWQEQS